MIQDIQPRQFHNEYSDLRPEPEDIALFYRDDSVAVAGEEEIRFPLVRDFPGAAFRYLFSEDEQRFFLVCDSDERALPAGLHLAHVMKYFRNAGPGYLAFAGAVGHHLYLWYRRNRFCGVCGTPMEHSARERAMICPHCQLTVYPVISPAVIVGVIHNGRILMTRYAGRIHKNYALIAGFAEIGESIEQTVHREVMEEVGLPVKRLRFYKSQPWPFSGSLLLGFFCELDGDIEDITLDQDELSEGGWFTPEDVPEDREHISLTSEMMGVFKRGEIEQITHRPLVG